MIMTGYNVHHKILVLSAFAALCIPLASAEAGSFNATPGGTCNVFTDSLDYTTCGSMTPETYPVSYDACLTPAATYMDAEAVKYNTLIEMNAYANDIIMNPASLLSPFCPKSFGTLRSDVWMGSPKVREIACNFTTIYYKSRFGCRASGDPCMTPSPHPPIVACKALAKLFSDSVCMYDTYEQIYLSLMMGNSSIPLMCEELLEDMDGDGSDGNSSGAHGVRGGPEACEGFTTYSSTSGSLSIRLDSTPGSARNCSFLIMPEWFYEANPAPVPPPQYAKAAANGSNVIRPPRMLTTPSVNASVKFVSMGRVLCKGALVGPAWALTTASCCSRIETYPMISVLAVRGSDPKPPPVSSVHLHPSWSIGQSAYDVCVVRLFGSNFGQYIAMHNNSLFAEEGNSCAETLLHTADTIGNVLQESPNPVNPRPLKACMASMPGGATGPAGTTTSGNATGATSGYPKDMNSTDNSGNETGGMNSTGRRAAGMGMDAPTNTSNETMDGAPPSDTEGIDMYVCAATSAACEGSENGTMLIATSQGKPSVLIGLLSGGDVCNGSAAFIRVDSVRQWALAVMGQHHHEDVIHPKTNLSVEVKSVSAPAGWMVSISSGAVQDPETSASVNRFFGGCDEEGTQIFDGGKGAMLVEFGVDACHEEQCPPVEFVLSWKAEGCAAVKSHGTCAGLPNCMWINDGCQESQCRLDLGWKEVLQMVKEGDAFTAGMGKKAVRNSYMDMGVWACVRDWNTKMQAACGVGPGEFACFGYEEKTKQFLPLGPNSARKLVRDIPPERDSLEMLWSHHAAAAM